ncbi:hypothetical protein ACWGBH_35800 [Streptomyces massasporeus]
MPDLLRRCARRPADEAETAADDLLNLCSTRADGSAPPPRPRCDTAAAVEPLLAAARPLTEGTYLPAMLPTAVTDESVREAVDELLAAAS